MEGLNKYMRLIHMEKFRLLYFVTQLKAPSVAVSRDNAGYY